MASNDLAAPASYSAFARLLHWLTLVLVIALLTLAWTAEGEPATPGGPPTFDPVLVALHQSIGLTVWTLTWLRLGWRHIAGVPAAPAGTAAWQRAGAAAMHAALYLLLLVTPILGYVATYSFGGSVNLYLLGHLPGLIGKDVELGKQVMGLHELCANLIWILAGLHALLALYHHYVLKDVVLRRMLGRA